MSVFEEFLEELTVVQKQRRGQHHDVWVPRERHHMLDLINKKRKESGRGPIDVKDVERVEGFALGHVDYTRKFALYCSELVDHERAVYLARSHEAQY